MSGCRDAETIEQAEQRIPQFLSHRNRAVTASDYHVLCRINPVNPVARAEVVHGFLPGHSLDVARRDVPGVVSVFVLPPAETAIGNWPKPNKALLKDVFQYLLNRVMAGTELYVLSPQFVPMAVSILVQVKDSRTEQETLKAVKTAITNYLWPLPEGGATGNGWGMGETVRANELLTQVARVDGVLAVNAVALFLDSSKGWRRLPATEDLTLLDYQLPELMAVQVEIGSAGEQPGLPQGISNDNSGNGIPVPVIPDVC
jgi:hypothetical protein